MKIFPILFGLIWVKRIKCDINLPDHNSSIERRLSESSDRSRSGFVYAPGDGNLYLNGKLFNFRNFNAPTIFEGGEYQGRDIFKSIAAFGAPVTRTYTLQIANDALEHGKLPPSAGHITGWDKRTNDWIYNEDQWRKMDQMLDLSRHYGVKLIIPIINQDYGNPDSNYIGDFNDLIRHRYGIYGYQEAGKKIDFFKDRSMIDSFKKLITFFLNRVNTYNGLRYGDDNTILAFETGNEMSWGQFANLSSQPAPAPWTIEVSRHLKTLAPKILVMDGSYSRHPSFAWEKEALESKYVDLFSYHFYGGGDTEAFDMLNGKVRAYGKTLVIGEHGFYSDVKVWRQVYKRMTCAGALAWSLLPHSEKSGFLTHGEGHNIHGYHVPGWQKQTSKEFDTQEEEVITSTYEASYTILGLEPPPKPIPGRPEALIVTNGTHAGLSWRGEAWAAGYEIFGAEAWGRNSNLISDVIPDNVEAGGIFIPLDPERPTDSLNMTPRKSKADESHKGWTDRKWCRKRSLLGCHGSHQLIDWRGRDILGNLVGHSMKVLASMEPIRDRDRSGGWYSVRGVSADGVPGKRSRPVFLETDWQNNKKGQ
ncbi:hypothetical protein PGTUg99_036517 [Puccinia graminis f. sp. tritici]|uniref:mannan endo-1,4-beta-mannosidase n=1 Tax=Puccinia graminis f. sp. tritici TaxID=56615 RepID=A0A5B0SET1_PUCGR|nr:hypothetical protein PGTUg99_036517 [Puccinia graminis f. sp. tritici]